MKRAGPFKTTRPPRDLCEAVARDYAEKHGVPYNDLLFSKNYTATRLRDKVWAEIIDRTQCSMAALGDTWGIEARVIQQAMKRERGKAQC